MFDSLMTLWSKFDSFLPETGPAAWARVLIFSIVLTSLIKAILTFTSARLRTVTRRTNLTWDDVSIDLLDGLRSFVLFVWFFFLFLRAHSEGGPAHRGVLALVVACTVYQVGIWGLYLLRRWRDQIVKNRIERDPSAAAALGLVYISLQGLFVVLVVLIGLSNLGVDIGALIAGLGVGGVAVALAAQNILGDLLASLSIVLDKPFVIGDFIITGNDMGTVEHIGIKTTRVRSLSGEELVFSNKDLLESRIRNYKRMWQRRVVQNFSVSYHTSDENIAAIPGWIHQFVDQEERLRYDRCHLSKFSPTSIDFELVFWVTDPDFNVYMDLQQEVLLKIFRKFNHENIQFSYQNFYVCEQNSTRSPDLSRQN